MVTRWGIDPLSRGSYSYQTVGMTNETRNEIKGSTWDRRLMFAGEHVSIHPAYVHGAWDSGLFAAEEALETLKLFKL